MTALSRRSLAAGAPLLAAVSFPAVAAPHPDAVLLRYCAEHVVNHDAYNANGGYVEAEDDPLWAPYARTLDAITTTPARTLEGVIAKARVARVEALNLAGEEEPDHTIAAQWAWDVVRDLLALTAGAAA